MSVTFSAFKFQENREIEFLPLDINLCNTNFCSLMRLLGYEEPEYCGTFEGGSLQELAEKVSFALAAIQAMPYLDSGTPTEESKGNKGCRIVSFGMREGYYQDRLSQLQEIVKLAIENNGGVTYS